MREIVPEPQFATLEQQTETAQLGMWVFIATEVMFFGALIFTYFIYRLTYWEQFRLAGADSRILLGSINAAILLTSSLTMVMAINFAKEGRQQRVIAFLLVTASLGVLFLCVKGYEYVLDYESNAVPSLNFAFKSGYHAPSELYWVWYFVATGFHALHVTIGVGAILAMTRLAWRGRFSPNYYTPLEVLGLYWSFVDTVWLFLFAAIYPLGRAVT
jgi:cytochrome c oxidase subunit III